MNEQAKQELEHARALVEQGKYDPAVKLCEAILNDAPNHVPTIILLTYIAYKMHTYPIGYHLGKRAIDVAPSEALTYFNFALNAQGLWLEDEALSAFKMTLRLTSDPHVVSMTHMNMAGLCIDYGRFREAEEWARKSLELNPYSPKAKANLGFALLGQHKWEGWEYYSYSLGMNMRQKQKFNDEPDWDFEPGKVVAVYGEQGIGDELSFSSMLPDAAKDCKKLIVSCDSRLETLFKRSFPMCKVYGTRKAKEDDGYVWDKEDHEIDASLAMGELGMKYRVREDQFTGEPFMVADPDKRAMWRTMFDRQKKPCIGIAWTGGIPNTGRKFRTLTLEQLKPLLSSVNAQWISLQYLDASAELREFKKANPEIDIVQHDCATLTKNYDDTAAMVAELDLVICIQTAVAHLAGSLGKECWVLLPRNSQWRYGEKGTTMPWYKSLRVLRQRSLNDWHGPLGEITGMLRKRYGRRQEQRELVEEAA